MPIIRAVPIKDASATALTSCGVGTAYDVGGVYAGQRLYSALHVLSSSTGALVLRIQGSSSSAFGAGKFTSHVAFTSQTSVGGQWATPLTTANVTSTFQQFWRAEWGMTTSGESYKLVSWIGIQA
jgi:hypothetical protein